MTFALLFWCAKVSQAYIKARTTVKRADSEPTAEILELFTSSSAGVSTIRAFGAVDQFIDQMHSRLDRLSTARRHFWIFNRWLGLQMSLIGILFTTGTGMILLSSTSIIDASLVGFTLTFSLEFSQVLFKAVNNFGILETYMDAAGAVIAYSRLETEKQGGDDIPERWPEKGEIEVRGLNVSYSPDMPLVLKDLSFTVESHKRVGIVGRTGAGKSSLTLSLLRLIEPQGGCISIDGIDISTIKLQALRSNIAFIPQDPVLFSGTVRSNLDYFQQVPERKLRDALRRVKLSGEEEDDVPGFFTLDSPISPGGVNMSQGQRQLLCLARTLITNASIVILDEATSAIDDDTDSWIQETITNGFGGTVVVVAHRLKTIATFDNIIVMDDGKIAEIGSPATLLSNKGLFFELVQNSDECEVLIDTIRKHSR